MLLLEESSVSTKCDALVPNREAIRKYVKAFGVTGFITDTNVTCRGHVLRKTGRNWRYFPEQCDRVQTANSRTLFYIDLKVVNHT
jgi:hypothetical protein